MKMDRKISCPACGSPFPLQARGIVMGIFHTIIAIIICATILAAVDIIYSSKSVTEIHHISSCENMMNLLPMGD